jgi:hypothetical protein
MERDPVTSSNLKAVGYDENTRTLEVEFLSGKVFQYADVPPQSHQSMMAADSPGSFFQKYIRQAYAAMEVEQA